ncbi:hypothetical protein PMAYCL1PPCAC_05104, partial [Pristionchus mayeri]
SNEVANLEDESFAQAAKPNPVRAIAHTSKATAMKRDAFLTWAPIQSVWKYLGSLWSKLATIFETNCKC